MIYAFVRFLVTLENDLITGYVANTIVNHHVNSFSDYLWMVGLAVNVQYYSIKPLCTTEMTLSSILIPLGYLLKQGTPNTS